MRVHFVYTEFQNKGRLNHIGVWPTKTACGLKDFEVGSESKEDVDCEGCLTNLAGLDAGLS